MSVDLRQSPHTKAIRYSGKEVYFHIANELDHIQKEILVTSKFYEEELLEYLAECIAPDKYVVDVGANIGNHTVFFAAIKGCRVIAIEPNSYLVKILKQNIALNEVAGRVEVIEGAISDVRKQATLYVDNPNNLGSGYLAGVSNHGVTHSSVEQVECYLLDELVKSDRVVGLLKIDVEGSEMDVLRSSLGILRRDVPVLVVECHNYSRFVEVLKLLQDAGYYPVHRFNSTPTIVFFPKFDGSKALYHAMAEQVWCFGQQQFEIRKSLSASIGVKIQAHSEVIESALSSANKVIDQSLNGVREVVEQVNQTSSAQFGTLARSLSEMRADFTRSRELEDANKTQASKIEKLQRESAAYRSTMEKNAKEIKKLKKYVRELETSVSFRLGRMIVDAARAPLPGLMRLPVAVVRLFLDRNKRVAAPEPVAAELAKKAGVAAEPAADAPLVSVIVTVFNKQDWLADSLRSLLLQSYKNLEVIVVDDRSTDGSWQLLQQIARKDGRVKLFRNRENRGTYWSKNFGIVKASGKFITFHDADDISRQTRIEVQVRALLKNAALSAVYGRYLRRDEAGEVVQVGTRINRPALITLMFSKDIVAKIGYFDSVRYGADSEYLERLTAVFGENAIRLLGDVLYEAPTVSDSLTGSGGGKLTYNESSHVYELPPTRQAYVSNFRFWHGQIKSVGQAYIGYPLSQRRFDAPQEMLAERGSVVGARVFASLATMPSRVELLRQVVDRILPQVDGLYVYLNNFSETPTFLINDKIVLQHSSETGDLRDNGKFFFSHQLGRNCYHVTLDDDIVYPVDYVQKMILTLQKYDNRVMVGVHGFNFPENFVRFFVGREVLHFRERLDQDRFVNILGTGTVAYHTSLVELNCAQFETTGMVDLWVARTAKAAGIPLVSVMRPKNWLTPMENEEESNLFSEFRHQDNVQTELVRSAGSWWFETLSTAYRVTLTHAVASYDDQELVDYGFDVASLNLFLGRKKLDIEIVITGWNCRDEAIICIESVLAQKPNHYQLRIHVVDDSSDDGTYEQLIEKYSESNQIRFYRTESNLGPAYSRRLALKEIADPDCIVALLDLDDVLTADALMRVAQKYHNHPDCEMTYGNWQNQHGVRNQQDFYTRDEIDSRQYFESEVFNFAPLRTFKRKLFDGIEDARFKDENGAWLRYCSDVAMMFGVARQLDSKAIQVIDRPIYIYNQHRPGGTQIRFRERKREMYKYIQASYRDGA